jgi:squalene synthase HpnC
MADEGDLSDAARIDLLDGAREQVESIAAGQAPSEPLYLALADVVARYQLPTGLLLDLLAAFRQDVTKTRYANFEELLAYCRLSANPVGRLLLHLFSEATEQNLQHSDDICSALQLANFWQDFGEDLRDRNRIYLPLDELHRAGLDEAKLTAREQHPALHRLLAEQIARSEAMIRRGMPLGGRLRGRFGVEIRVTVLGGLAVLRAAGRRTDCYARPVLGRRDRLAMLCGGLLPTRRWRPVAGPPD